MITQSFDLNMIPSSAPVVVHVDQYDHGEGRFIISLYNGDTPYTPTGTAVIQGAKPDGKGFEYSATLSGNTVTANLTEQMTAVFGIVRAQIVITETSGRTGTFVFNLDVQKSALPADADMSHSEYQIVEELLEDVQQAAADAAQSAEDADASAEDSEAWAVGTRDGVPVTSDDPTYHNNSKWWAEHGGGGGGGGHTIVNAKGQDMTARTALKFANMRVTDDAAHNQTVVESGSVVTITTAESTLYGEDVTLSDGTTTLTETFDSSGHAVFYGVSLTGNLTITATDGTDTATDSLPVPYFGIYAKAISFWNATIDVTTTTSDFNGLTVYAKKNGVTKGSAVFSSGTANITVPETGSYTLEVTQDWHTYTSQAIPVSDQTTYPASINGFKAPISLTTSTTEFRGQSISVSLDGTPITLSTPLAFDGSGDASFDALAAGTYVFTLTYQGEPYTATVVVTTETSYSGVIKMWTATIKVTASSQLYSQSVTVYKGSTSVGTVTLDATGKADILVHEAGTYYIKGVYDGWTYSTDAISVSAETDYPVNLDVFICTLSISTTSSELFSQTITVTKNGSTVGTTTFSAGSGGTATASYNVHETGTYTLTCTYSGDDYSSDITIVSGDNGQTKTISIETGLKLSDWLTEAGLNPASYADFAAVEADEAAVRKLMTIHDAVDYLATAEAGDPLMEDVINSDICAKWINLRDYALDTLYANTDIASAMDTADKYFYGEWVKLSDSPETWGAKGNVPIMTTDTAPYGAAGATVYSGYSQSPPYKAFIGENTGENTIGSFGVNGCIYYKFVNPIAVKKVHFENRNYSADDNLRIKTFKIQASNDGSTWTDITNLITRPDTDNAAAAPCDVDISENDAYYLYWAVYATDVFTTSTSLRTKAGCSKLQFYGREMKPLVPTMTIDTAPYGKVIGTPDYSSAYPKWKAFNGDRAISNTNIASTKQSTQNADYAIGYGFRELTCRYISETVYRANNTFYPVTLQVQGSDDNLTWNTVYSYTQDISAADASVIGHQFANNNSYKYWRLYADSAPSNGSGVWCFPTRELQFYGFDYSEYDWDSTNPRHYIYDHGVELDTVTITGTGSKGDNSITLSAQNAQAVASLDTTSYTAMGGKVGARASGTNQLLCGASASNFSANNMPDGNGIDITNVNGTNDVGVKQTAAGTFDIEEVWVL